ncbi:unnamed protein product [Urochloa decumbens]|uniref:DNA sliding clamp PCNA n=2 Tax=Urochloa decumbens TaxID=240449 RepID=A0ABC8ZNP0_9POAL
MFELKLEKESLFLRVLEAILDLVDVASVDFFSTGLRLQAVDTEHVAVISLFFRAEEFPHYSCEENSSFCIPIDDMVKAIRTADVDHNITIKVDDENFDTITLSFESPEGNITTAYDLRLVEGERPCFKIPVWKDLESNYEAFVEMPSVEFMRVCRYLSNVDDDGEISVTEEGLKFFALGKSGRAMIKYEKTEKATVKLQMQESVSVTFDPKYMNCFAKVSTMFSQVKICLSKTQPLMVECKTALKSYIRCFVTPKAIPEIEEEEIIQGHSSERTRKTKD